MKISDLINTLEFIKNEYGDIPVKFSKPVYKLNEYGAVKNGKITTYSPDAITLARWMRNSEYVDTDDIDLTIQDDELIIS